MAAVSWFRKVILLLLVVPLFALIVLLAIGTVNMMNNEFYGRMTEFAAIPLETPADQDGLPRLTLVIHRLIPEENLAEVSLVLEVRSGTAIAREMKEARLSLTASLRDGLAIAPFGVFGSCTLDESALGREAAQSDRFLVPCAPTVEGYPFDDFMLRPILRVTRSDGLEARYSGQIQKSMRGRLLSVTVSGGFPDVRLARTKVELWCVLIVAVVFLLLCVLVAVRIVSSTESLTGPQEVVALASFILAIAGMRDVLGLDRNSGMSFFELVIVGVPFVALAIALGYRQLRRKASA